MMHASVVEEDVNSDYILIAEDDRLSANLFSEGLAGAGFPVKIAYSGDEAMQTIKSSLPRLAIVDINLPDMSGLELVRQLTVEPPPFFVLSAVRVEETIAEAIDLGALGYVVKPIEIAQLLPLVRAALARGAELTNMRIENRKLSEAINNARSISTAIGIIMERYRLKQNVAASALRFMARSQQRKMHAVGHDIVEASFSMNLPHDVLRRAGSE
jgi:two-component system, response regulator PdtaR